MNNQPLPSASPSGPFPLETNLRRLKPSLGQLVPIIAGVGILVAQEGLWEKVREWAGSTVGLILLSLTLAVLLFYAMDLYLKQVWYNERGIGISKAWGGSKTWYSFDELKSGQFKMHKRPRIIGGRRGRFSPSSRMTLEFHTGSVRLWPNLYESKSMTDLLSILSRRFPDSYSTSQPSQDMKRVQQKQARQSGVPTSSGKSASQPVPGSSRELGKPLYPTKNAAPGNQTQRGLAQYLDKQSKGRQ